MSPYKNQFRIIAGHWRRRRLHFPAECEVRPTPDRARETLFNWLMPVIEGARCLDLFAGSGALGLEALSRGAAQVVFVEREWRLGSAIQDDLKVLAAAGGKVVTADAMTWLAASIHAFDIVFLDPPFDSELLAPACERLEAGGWLAAHAHIYLEHRMGAALELPENWRIMRSARAGLVVSVLAVRVDEQNAVT